MKIFYYNIVKGQTLQDIENGTLTFTCEELGLAPMEIISLQKLVMFLGETYNTNSQSQYYFFGFGYPAGYQYFYESDDGNIQYGFINVTSN